jgi:hypothetical protein
MSKTSYNLEQRNFVIKKRLNKLLILKTITTYAKNLLQLGTKKLRNRAKLNKLLEVPVTITTNAKNLHLAPPWKQNTSGYNVTNNTQESHMLNFFVIPHLGNKMQVDTK